MNILTIIFQMWDPCVTHIMGHKINESFVNNDNNMTNDNNNITNDNDFRYFLNSIGNRFYFLPITNKEIINTIVL